MGWKNEGPEVFIIPPELDLLSFDVLRKNRVMLCADVIEFIVFAFIVFFFLS